MLTQRILFPLKNQILVLCALPQSLPLRNYTLPAEEEPEKKKKVRIPKINILLQDKTIISMTMEQALKWAKRRDITLTHLPDPPKFADYAGRQVYEALTKSEHVKQSADGLEVPEDDKHVKTLDLSWKIAPHDFDIKLKQVHRWLGRKFVVHLILRSGTDKEALNQKCALIQEQFKTMCTISTNTKKSQTIITLLPMDSGESDHESSEGSPNGP